MITLTDSVTLNCEAPSSVSVSRCHFYIGSIVRVFSCQKTLTATELLQISNQRSPADVKVSCFYTVKYEDSDSPSPHSDTTSISVRSEWTRLLWTHILISCYGIGTNCKVALNRVQVFRGARRFLMAVLCHYKWIFRMFLDTFKFEWLRIYASIFSSSST